MTIFCYYKYKNISIINYMGDFYLLFQTLKCSKIKKNQKFQKKSKILFKSKNEIENIKKKKAFYCCCLNSLTK